MPIKITCSCGKTAVVPDEYAGRTGRCRSCQAQITVVATPEPVVAPRTPPTPQSDTFQPTVARLTKEPPAEPRENVAPADELFARDRYLLRQKHLAINEKYAVWDENGAALMFVERPSHLFRNLLAMLCAFLAGGTLFTLLGFTYKGVPEPVRDSYLFLGIPLAIAAIIAVYIMLEQKRHVEFYRSEAKTQKVLRIIQDAKVQLLYATYTVTDGRDRLIGTFRKNYLWDLLRKQWECRNNRGEVIFITREDSIIKSLLRRLVGPLFGLLRLNFIFCDPQTGVVLGEFNRSFTILDRYVLDLSQDFGNQLDRRLALAMAVMLDTGERR